MPLSTPEPPQAVRPPPNPHKLDPDVWGPYYWFVLHTIAYCYPLIPNDLTKKKYYEFIQNLPLFIPVEEIGNSFAVLIDKYPVSPYLDSRESFIRWMNFIHNKINEMIGKEEKSLTESLNAYFQHYAPKHVQQKQQMRFWKQCAYFVVLVALIILIFAVTRDRV